MRSKARAKPPVPNTATTVENAVQQNLAPTDTTTTPTTTSPQRHSGTRDPGNGRLTAPAPGRRYPQTSRSRPPSGDSTTNPATGAVTTPGNPVPSTGNAGITNTRAYSSNYVPGTQPAMTPGTAGAVGQPGMTYSSVNPMGTTMAPGPSRGRAQEPIGRRRRPRTPQCTLPPGTPPQPRRTTPHRPRCTRCDSAAALFGGLFGRPIAEFYSTMPPTYTYGTAPGTYTYAPAPGTYTYAPSPY